MHALALKHPTLTLLVDHAGLSGNPSSAFQELVVLESLQDVKNVSVKLSALSWSLPPDVESRRLILDKLQQVTMLFGADRLLWGSDLTRVKGGYQESLATVSVSRSTSLSFVKVAPARTSGAKWGAFTARHRACADSMSLKRHRDPGRP